MIPPLIGGLQKTTSHSVVLPFYIYASLGFLAGTTLLLFSTDALGASYFSPKMLAITHTMALAWGTMIIFGASHQLLPVLVECKLNSELLAYLTFVFAAVGIPFLIYGFYVFDLGWPVLVGALLINIAVCCYLGNVLGSFLRGNTKNVHAWYVLTATLWLLATTLFGLMLAVNFRLPILPRNSLGYLSVHAHLGIVGWFALTVVGVGARWIALFMISKYTNDRTLWLIFVLLNSALAGFTMLALARTSPLLFYIPILLGLAAVLLFGRYCYMAYLVRIRKRLDAQVKTALISVVQLSLPLAVLIPAIALLPPGRFSGMAQLYGFCIFFGWLTAIILGMTFKTMPFIVWNKVYHNQAHKGKTPAPRELFSDRIYRLMMYCYLGGFAAFVPGIVLLNQVLLKTGAAALLITAALQVYNVLLTAGHKSKQA